MIVRDESSTIGEVENLLKSLHWEVHLTFSKNQEGLLSAQKGDWRPDTYAESSSLAISCLQTASTRERERDLVHKLLELSIKLKTITNYFILIPYLEENIF